VEQGDRGYGGALKAGFRAAKGEYILTMDADLSHMPAVIAAPWQHRERADIVIASRYVEGGSAQVPFGRYFFSRVRKGRTSAITPAS
jgi:dolichol-phosphate mannosyltransferase